VNAPAPKVVIELDVTEAVALRAMLIAELRLIEKRRGSRRRKVALKPLLEYRAALQATLAIVEKALGSTLTSIVKS